MPRAHRREEFGYIAREPAPEFHLFRRDAEERLPHGASLAGLELERFDADPDFHLCAPLIVYLELTARCNLSCRYCYLGGRAAGDGELSGAELGRLLERLAQMETFMVVFTGGEPLLRREFVDLANRAVRLGLGVGVITNGTLLDRHPLAELDRRVVFALSVDGLALNKAVRGVEFAGVASGLFTLRRLGFEASVLSTLNRVTLRDAVGLFDWCRENRFRFIAYDCQPVGRAQADGGVTLRVADVPRAMGVFRHIRRVREAAPNREWVQWERAAVDASYFTQLMKLAYRFEMATRRCKGGRSVAYVDGHGVVYPCSNCRAQALFPAGSIRERDFADIWSGGFGRARALGWDDFGPCRRCKLAREPYVCKFRCPPLSSALNRGELTGCGASPYIRAMLRLRTREPS